MPVVTFFRFILQAQMSQCRDLLESEANGEIFIHCLGNAINRGITLALKLVEESNNRLGYEANTSSIDLIGETRILHFEKCKYRKNAFVLMFVFFIDFLDFR